MYHIITWGSYDDYQIVTLIKTDKNLDELNKEFHRKYNIPWDDNYITGDYKDRKQRKEIAINLINDGFSIYRKYEEGSEFTNAFIQWLVNEHQVEVLEYKENRFDQDPDEE